MPLCAGTGPRFLFVENHQRITAMTSHNIIRIGFAALVNSALTSRAHCKRFAFQLLLKDPAKKSIIWRQVAQLG